MRTNHVLIDFENVHVKSLELLKGEHFRVIVFLGPKNTKLPVDLVLAMQNSGERAAYVVLGAPFSSRLAGPTRDAASPMQFGKGLGDRLHPQGNVAMAGIHQGNR